MLPRPSLKALLLAGLALGSLPAHAASPPPGAPAPAEAIKVGNRTVAYVRASVFGYSAAERAEAATQRLHDALEETPLAPLKVGTREMPQGVAVVIDDHALFLITPEDVNTLLEETPASVAAAAARALERAIGEVREEREPKALLEGLARFSVVTLVWLLLLRGTYRFNRWFGERFSRTVVRRAEQIGVTERTEVPLASVYLFSRRAVAALAWVLALFATSSWLGLALGSFAWTRPFGEQVEGSLMSLLITLAQETFEAIPGLMVVVLIVLFTRFVVGLMRPVFDRIERSEVETGILNRHTAATTRRLLTATLVLFAFAMAYPYLPGSQTEAFKGLSVLAGLMVSLGASGVVGQAASGLIILYAMALRPGQYVKVGESEGTIIEVGLFSTRLRTGLGEDVLLPNSFILANTLRNFSPPQGGPGFVLEAGVTIGYDAPWRQVEAMLLEAARRVPAVSANPAPYVIQTSLADFYVAYRLAAVSHEADPQRRMEARNRLHAAIQDVFNEHGVQIMSPHYVLDPRAPKVVPKERWRPAPAEGGDPK